MYHWHKIRRGFCRQFGRSSVGIGQSCRTRQKYGLSLNTKKTNYTINPNRRNYHKRSRNRKSEDIFLCCNNYYWRLGLVVTVVSSNKHFWPRHPTHYLIRNVSYKRGQYSAGLRRKWSCTGAPIKSGNGIFLFIRNWLA